MAEHPISRPGERERLKQMLRSGFAIAGLLLCISASSRLASGQPWPLPGIERPSRGWDYDGRRILGHIGHDICLWDAETGKLLHRMIIQNTFTGFFSVFIIVCLCIFTI